MANLILKWTAEMLEANSQLKGRLSELRTQVKTSFEEGGKKVAIVNNTIVEGSKRTWSQYEKIISTHAERGEKSVWRSFQIVLDKANAVLRLMGSARSARRR